MWVSHDECSLGVEATWYLSFQSFLMLACSMCLFDFASRPVVPVSVHQTVSASRTAPNHLKQTTTAPRATRRTASGSYIGVRNLRTKRLDVAVSGSRNFIFWKFRVQATSEHAKSLQAFEPGTARAQERPRSRSQKLPRGG